MARQIKWFGSGVFFASLKHLSTTFASILVSVQSAYAMVMAWLRLDEMPRGRSPEP